MYSIRSTYATENPEKTVGVLPGTGQQYLPTVLWE